MNHYLAVRFYSGNAPISGFSRFGSAAVPVRTSKVAQSDSASDEEKSVESAVGNTRQLKRSGLKRSEQKSLVQQETERLQANSLGLSDTHAKLISIKSRNQQPVYVLAGNHKMRLRLENKPVKVIEYQAGQHIQIDNTLYKVTPEGILVQISDNAALINKLCADGLGKIHCSQGQLPNCNSLAQLMAAFNDPTGHLVRQILSQFSEKVIETKKGLEDCFLVQFGDFEVQIPKKDIRRSMKLGPIPFTSSDETFANAKRKFQSQHPVMGQVGRPLFAVAEKIIKHYSTEEFSWVKGDFKTTHGADGSLLVPLFEKAFHEVTGMQEYREAYKKIHRKYPDTTIIEPGFNQREDIIAVIDQAVQSKKWVPAPHRLDRTHSIRALRNADWLPKRADAFWDFLTSGSNQQTKFSYTSKFPLFQTYYNPNVCYVSTFVLPTGKLAKFRFDAWEHGSSRAFQDALDDMHTRDQAVWMKNLKAFLSLKSSEGAGVMVIGSRPAKDHIEEIEKKIELIPSSDTEKTEDGAEKKKKPETVSVNHAFIVDKVDHDTDTDTYSFKIKDPHNTKKPPT